MAFAVKVHLHSSGHLLLGALPAIATLYHQMEALSHAWTF